MGTVDFYFENGYDVNSHDCDYNNILRPSGVLRYLQETANLQIEDAGFGYDFCKSMGKAFVLSRVAVELCEPIYAYEKIIGRTWACPCGGVSFNRCSCLMKDGRVVAKLSSVWALLDFESKTLVRVADSGLVLPRGEPLVLSAPLKFRIPKTLSLKEAGTVKAGYSVCDRNMHINNTRYPDIFCDFLPSLEGKRMAQLSVSYLKEGHLGEEMKVYMAQEEETGAWFFRTEIGQDRQTGVEARLLLADL